MNLKKEIKLFLKPVKWKMKLSRKHKTIFYGNLEISANSYLQTNPDATPEELRNALGDPGELLDTYTRSIGVEEIRKAYRRSNWVLALSIIGVALLLLVSLYIYMYYGTNTTIIEYHGYKTL